jgi:DNA-directed RNA polymerase subunit RPC12/RpoP
MLTLDVTTHHNTMPQIGTTLWHCSRCAAFISIRSAQLMDEAMCPVCGLGVLDFCGQLSNMPCIQFGDA